MATALFGVVLTGVMVVAVVLTVASVAIQATTEFVKTLLHPIL